MKTGNAGTSGVRSHARKNLLPLKDCSFAGCTHSTEAFVSLTIPRNHWPGSCEGQSHQVHSCLWGTGTSMLNPWWHWGSLHAGTGVISTPEWIPPIQKQQSEKENVSKSGWQRWTQTWVLYPSPFLIILKTSPGHAHVYVTYTALKSSRLGTCVFYFKNLMGGGKRHSCTWDVGRGRENRNVPSMPFCMMFS